MDHRHSYIVYGPLANGATTTMFESIPTYPNPDRYWQVIEKWKVNQFYTAPTAIRAIAAAGEECHKYDMPSLRVLGSGENRSILRHGVGITEMRVGKVSHCRYLVADRNRRHIDYSFAGSDTLKPGSATFPFLE